MRVRPAKTQISLGICEDSDQTGQMLRLICLRWAHTHFVDFVMSWLKYVISMYLLLHRKPRDNQNIFKEREENTRLMYVDLHLIYL